jgi:phosphoribosyl 1,2-cyclic phosphodiesterase
VDRSRTAARAPVPEFDVWGCRGSHNLTPAVSRVGNNTVCASLVDGADLYVFDAGRGLLVLGHAMSSEVRFRKVKRVHVLVSHSHLDHWEGFKDVDWFWRRNNGLEVNVYGTREAVTAVRRGFAHPSYVPLEVLASGTAASLEFVTLRAGRRRQLAAWTLETFPLHHYSGFGKTRRFLDTLGFRLTREDGARVAYLCDHEPTRATREVEEQMLSETRLAIYDAHFADVASQRYGHGSQEHAAAMARRHPATLVLASHLGPMLSDSALHSTRRRFASGLENYRLAAEGLRLRWNAARGVFQAAR